MSTIATLALALALLLVPQRALAFETEPSIGNARAAVVTDGAGNVLYDLNGSEEMPMASITKVMTAIVALDSGIPLDTPIPVVDLEFSEGAQLSGYKAGDSPTLRELLMVTLVFSGNDAASNVAIAVGGSEQGFADLMNEKAAELGLTHTHFMNAHGLEEEGHYSCARDLCVMGRYAMENYPFIREAVSTRSLDIVAGGYQVTLGSTDDLMESYQGLLGIKTGNTESGASFLGAARRNNVTLYSCILCHDDKAERFSDTAAMLDWGFGLYEDKALAHADWKLRDAPWQDGFWLSCPVSAQRDVTGSVFCEGDLGYRTVMLRPNTLAAPQAPYGTTVWQQEGRHVESVTYRTGAPQQGSAWNPIVQPLLTGVGE